MKYLYLDTNVYLHYKDFEQVGWRAMVRDDVTIAVPYFVVGEIDKHKDQDRGRVQKRAKKTATRFSEIFLDGIATTMPVVVVDNPPVEGFAKNQLSKEISDDWILLSALCSGQDRQEIIIVSGDNGILMKAKQKGLKFLKMPDSLLLAVELSEEEKEIKKLKEELALYQKRQPIPAIHFAEEGDHIRLTKPTFVDIEEELTSYKQELKATHPYASEQSESFEELRIMESWARQLSHSTIEQRQKYNEELDDYFDKKIAEKRLLIMKNRLDLRFKCLDFYLVNSGTAALGNTNIFLSFPEEVRLYNDEAREDVDVEEIKEPVLNKLLGDLAGLNFNEILHGKKYHTIEKCKLGASMKTSELSFQVSDLNHGMIRKLTYDKEIYIDVAQCGSYEIEWTVIDSNLLQPVSGKLYVIVD